MKKEIGSYIDRTYKVVRQDLIHRFKEAGVNITPEQWVILNKLKDRSQYQSDLANDSFKDHPTVSRIINLLEKKQLVTRKQDKADGRRFWISLTETGLAEVKKAEEPVGLSREKGWNNLSEREYNTLIRLLDKIFQNYSDSR